MDIIPPTTGVQADMRRVSTLCSWLLSVAVVALAGADTPAPAPANDPAVLQRLLEVQRTTTTASGRFTQSTVRADDPAGGGTEYQGRFDLQAPDRYNVIYTNPKDEEWRQRHCSDGTTRWTVEQLFADQPPEVSAKPVKGDGGPDGGGGDGDAVGRIAALLRGDREAVTKDFTVQASAVGEGFALVLTPKPGGAIAEHLVKIEGDLDSAGHVKALRFFDRQGNLVTIVVTEATYGQPIPPETFTHQAP